MVFFGDHPRIPTLSLQAGLVSTKPTQPGTVLCNLFNDLSSFGKCSEPSLTKGTGLFDTLLEPTVNMGTKHVFVSEICHHPWV